MNWIEILVVRFLRIGYKILIGKIRKYGLYFVISAGEFVKEIGKGGECNGRFEMTNKGIKLSQRE